METIKEQVFDIFNDNDVKLQNLLILYKNSPDNLFLETINTLTNIYNLQPTIILLNLLTVILNSEIDNIYKIQILECIYLENENLCIHYIFKIFILNNIFYNNFIFINLLKYVLQKNTFEFQDILNIDSNLLPLNCDFIYDYFIVNIFNNTNINLNDRYKILIDLTHNTRISDFYIYKFYNFWVFNQNINKYKILASQYLLQNPIDTQINDIYCILLSICNDTELDYNLRADSADLLLRYGNDDIKNTARDIIILLGKDVYKFKTIYNNKQNVHNIDIDTNIKLFLDNLNNINNLDINIINDFLLTLKPYTSTEIEAINGSIMRIKIDNTLYNNLSLLNIFYKIYSKVINYTEPYKSTLLLRINEELIDMFNTCSSGHLTRLVNVLSGFEDTIKISFYEQIKSNLFARLYKRIQNILNVGDFKIIKGQKIKMTETELQDYQNNILTELTTQDKPNLLNFLNNNIFDIHNELYSEFVPTYLNDNTFIEYIRKAVMEFEDCN